MADIRVTPGPLVIASHNGGKVNEIRDLLEPFGFQIASAGELGLADPEETGTTFEENAVLKAETACRAAGLPALADDSGLAVDALDGDPGIYSARWAPVGDDGKRDFAMAMRNVEEKLQASGALQAGDRGAQFVCVLALARPGLETVTFAGIARGTMVWPPRGTMGFGYDPVFLPEGHERTFGEMSAEEKHGWTPELGGKSGLSHRARAFALFAEACLEVPARGKTAGET
jgi:XTP/dITP diphosphohydrolase